MLGTLLRKPRGKTAGFQKCNGMNRKVKNNAPDTKKSGAALGKRLKPILNVFAGASAGDFSADRALGWGRGKLVTVHEGIHLLFYVIRTVLKRNRAIIHKLRTANALLEDTKRAMLNLIEDVEIEKKKLGEEKEHRGALLASIADGVFAVDTGLKIIGMNHAAEELLGWSRADALGRHADEVVPITNADGILNVERPIARALKQKIKVMIDSQSEYYMKRRKGDLFPVNLTAAPVITDGVVIGGIGVFRDATRQKELDRAKNEFISLASHQLRTPPSIIGMYTEMLLSEREALGERQRDYIREIHDANRRMMDLVNTLLNLSRIELGTFKTGQDTADVAITVRRITDLYAAKFKEKSIGFSFFMEDKLPRVACDEANLDIVVENLISNAVKYTPEGGIVSVRGERMGGLVRLTVSDSGCGISEKDKPQIFEKFFRSDNARKISGEGTGVGLYIVKSIIERAGGTISFHSKEGEGSAFFLTLRPVSASASRPKLKLLIVEDEHPIRKALEHALGRAGYEISSAGDGEEGLRRALEFLPDVMVVDINLPKMDGLSMLEQIRNVSGGTLPPVVVFTNYDGEYLKRARAMGVKQYLRKNTNTLADVVETVRAYAKP